jgi:hypothetical protein
MDYPLFHLVEPPEFAEAKSRGGECAAVVGRLIPDLTGERRLSSSAPK